jgi:hypothetical protein
VLSCLAAFSVDKLTLVRFIRQPAGQRNLIAFGIVLDERNALTRPDEFRSFQIFNFGVDVRHLLPHQRQKGFLL